MICNQIIRFLHIGRPSWNSINKSLLAKLRKKTGYTFANCRKALELHSNDIEQAEKWLQEQAQILGWAKATKLEGRPTAQGLVAVTVQHNCATIVEVNCETDFVARNKNFQAMAEVAVAACIRFTTNQIVTTYLTKIGLDTERLKCLPGEGGKPLVDHVALQIGNLGENISLRRAICMGAGEGVKLAGYTHPAPSNQADTLLGKYGALVAFKINPDQKGNWHELGRQLCQHVVGMNPSKIGVMGIDKPVNNPDDECCMIHQEYLLDPTQTVAQLISDNGISLLDFARFECGEDLQTQVQDPQLDLAVELGG